MKPKIIYLTDTSFGVLPFDKSEERIHGYISVDLIKEWAQKNIFKIFIGGMDIKTYISYDEFLNFIEKEEEK